MKVIAATKIWKFDKDGNERPIQEQLDRRKADESNAFIHIDWYRKNPLRKGIAANRAHQRRLDHLDDIREDIKSLEKRL